MYTSTKQEGQVLESAVLSGPGAAGTAWLRCVAWGVTELHQAGPHRRGRSAPWARHPAQAPTRAPSPTAGEKGGKGDGFYLMAIGS